MTNTVQLSDAQSERSYVSALLVDPTMSQRCRLEPSALTVVALKTVLTAIYATERTNDNRDLSTR